MKPFPPVPAGRGDRLDLHNAGVDQPTAADGRCGTIHLPTGRICEAPARHADGCDFVLPSVDPSRRPAT